MSHSQLVDAEYILESAARRFVREQEAWESVEALQRAARRYAEAKTLDSVQDLARAVSYQLKPGERIVPQAEMDDILQKSCLL
jgi:hypothetical protein